MMAALETFFNCNGFNSSPTYTAYYFTDINTQAPISGNICAAHYDSLVSGATFIVGG